MPIANNHIRDEATGVKQRFSGAGSEVFRSEREFDAFGRFFQECMEIEWARVHGELAVGCAWPFFLWTIAIEFDAVVVRIAQVDGIAHAVVGRAFELNSCGEDALKRSRERRSIR